MAHDLDFIADADGKVVLSLGIGGDDEIAEPTEDLKEQEDIVSDTVEETVPDTASAEVLATVKVLQARLSLEQEKYKKKKPKR